MAKKRGGPTLAVRRAVTRIIRQLQNLAFRSTPSAYSALNNAANTLASGIGLRRANRTRKRRARLAAAPTPGEQSK
jgi:hypothetical protein